MYDSVNVDGIPSGATIVAGYYYGTYANLTAMRERFPKAVVVGITPTASVADGIVDVLDVETGDATASQTEGWITAQKAKGYYRPTIYTSLSNVPAVRQGTGKYVLGTDYDLWVADYDGNENVVYAGAAAKQFKSTSGYDESVIYDSAWPHRKAPAKKGLAAPKSLSQTAYASFTDFSWSPVSGAKSYDFQVGQGTVQVYRKSITGTHAEGIPTQPGNKYWWRVASEPNPAGWSPESTFTTPSDAFPAPSGLAVAGPVTYSFTWKAAALNGKAAASYTFAVYKDGSLVSEKSVTGTSTSVVLTHGIEYEIHVWANGGPAAPPHASVTITA